MAKTEEEAVPRDSSEFIESSILNIIIPSDGQLDIEHVPRTLAAHGEVDSPFAANEQRRALFFDETVAIYVTLRTPYLGDEALKSYLGRLVIDIEAQVVNTQRDGNGGPSGHEVIYHASVENVQDPLVVVQGPEEPISGGDSRHLFVAWKASVFLVRPRLRLQDPSIIFSVNANLKPLGQPEKGGPRDEYMASQEPSGMNLLEAFKDDPALNGVTPWVSAQRVSRVAPLGQTSTEFMRCLASSGRLDLKVYPAINARVRYSRPNASPNHHSVIASLDIDITPFAKSEVNLTDVSLKIHGGTVEELTHVFSLGLPILCKPQDDLTFLYRLLPDDWIAPSKPPLRTLEIGIAATVFLTPTCTPTISMHWNTTLDFTPPLNPGYGHPTQPIQRPHRPTQLSIGGSAFDSSPITSSLALTRPDALPTSHEPVARAPPLLRDPSVPDFGVTVTFTGGPPSHPIHPGIPFVWSVFIVNRSDRARKLALLVLPRTRRADSRATTRHGHGRGRPGSSPHAAEAFIEESVLHAMQRTAAVDATDLVCLSTDTRVGPLAPQACYEVELKFVALRTGVLDVDGVRVLDLGTQEHVDIRDLPSVVATPASVVEAG